MNSSEAVVKFCLYVAGELPNSQRARSNLEAFCREHLAERYSIEVLDVTQSPERALEDNVLMTPQLVVLNGESRRVIVGSLQDRTALFEAVGLGARV
ncbi:circadian clock KaiB family protein [Fodinicurvata fenggangensis]|uniref:circadian clock KaiB family protein n=1 Tax=Fodinicurvata fenggangensis TaxID=1121830 RepID=UPI00047D7C86|nr:circadian clock KaiB family protein [Fodinicurvata fenggangensis]